MDVDSRRQNPAARRCAVFGVNGYLGGNLAHALQTRGDSVVGYDLQDGPAEANLDYRRFDIASEEAWRTFGTCGRTGGTQAQCCLYSAPSRIHSFSSDRSSSESVLLLDAGGIIIAPFA